MNGGVGANTIGSLRAGRLLQTATGLVDLATGCAARLEGLAIPLDEASGVLSLGRVARDDARGWHADAWLGQDWLGRWVAWTIRLPGVDLAEERRTGDGADAGEGAAWDLTAWGIEDIAVTQAASAAQWCRLASLTRRLGLVPVHLSLLSQVPSGHAGGWPPLVVGVPAECSTSTCPACLEAWVRLGGRIGGLVRVSGLPDAWGRARGDPAASDRYDRWRLPAAHHPSHQRALRRAWRALGQAPACPAFARISTSSEGHERMTHLELLDVSTQLDEQRRDEDALAAACRAVRQHTEALHAAVVSTRDGDARVLASDGPPGDSTLAWRHLCRSDAPEALASTAGWHAVGRPDRPPADIWMGARWPSADAGRTHQALLAVFARLAAARASNRPAIEREFARGLEESLVGDSVVMRDVRAQIALAARAPFPVLIRGESGCGKELAARAIHGLGPRRHRRCAAINCAALPDDLIESELFGHVRGAFTGAATDRHGLFDEADGGTLFLDEIGELGVRAQAKLLRVLQDGEVKRVGENHVRRVDVRVIAATNVSLEDAVRRGVFRADLYYRLDVVRVRMPALRERREDIATLARQFWHDCTARLGSRARLDGRVLDILAQCDWPGNVRQLQNILAALAVRVPPRGRVTIGDLPPELLGTASACRFGATGLDRARREFEASYVREALCRAGGRPSTAARDLGLTRQGLSKLVKRLGLDGEEARPRLP